MSAGAAGASNEAAGGMSIDPPVPTEWIGSALARAVLPSHALALPAAAAAAPRRCCTRCWRWAAASSCCSSATWGGPAARALSATRSAPGGRAALGQLVLVLVTLESCVAWHVPCACGRLAAPPKGWRVAASRQAAASGPGGLLASHPLAPGTLCGEPMSVSSALACQAADLSLPRPHRLLMDFHIGFLVYELLFYTRHTKLVRPQVCRRRELPPFVPARSAPTAPSNTLGGICKSSGSHRACRDRVSAELACGAGGLADGA